MFVLDMPKVLRQCDILRRVSGLVGSFVLASSLSLSFVFLFACHTHVDMFLPLFCTLAFFFTKQTAYQIYWAGFVQIEKNGRYKEKSDKFLVFDSQKHKIRNIYFFLKRNKNKKWKKRFFIFFYTIFFIFLLFFFIFFYFFYLFLFILFYYYYYYFFIFFDFFNLFEIILFIFLFFFLNSLFPQKFLKFKVGPWI